MEDNDHLLEKVEDGGPLVTGDMDLVATQKYVYNKFCLQLIETLQELYFTVAKEGKIEGRCYVPRPNKSIPGSWATATTTWSLWRRTSPRGSFWSGASLLPLPLCVPPLRLPRPLLSPFVRWRQGFA